MKAKENNCFLRKPVRPRAPASCYPPFWKVLFQVHRNHCWTRKKNSQCYEELAHKRSWEPCGKTMKTAPLYSYTQRKKWASLSIWAWEEKPLHTFSWVCCPITVQENWVQQIYKPHCVIYKKILKHGFPNRPQDKFKMAREDQKKHKRLTLRRKLPFS